MELPLTLAGSGWIHLTC